MVLFLFPIGLVLILAPKLRTFALSLGAVAVVVATQELILCVSGLLLRASVRLSTTDLGKSRVTVTTFCPTRLAEPLEDAITLEVVSLCRTRGGAGT